MSTLTSRDMVSSGKSSTRLHAPPGGKSSISLGDAHSTTPPPSFNSNGERIRIGAAAVPSPLQLPKDAVLLDSKVDDININTVAPIDNNISAVATYKIGLLVTGTNSATDIVAQSMCKLFKSNGIVASDILIYKTTELLSLPYFAKAMTAKCHLVIASCILIGTSSSQVSTSHSIASSLYTLGLQMDTPIIPNVICIDNLLELKVTASAKIDPAVTAAINTLSLLDGTYQRVDAAVFDADTEPIHTTVSPSSKLKTTSSDVTDLFVDMLLDQLRSTLKQYGVKGIFGLSRKFRIIDDDNSMTLDIAEFTKSMKEMNLSWTSEQTQAIFSYFDKDKSGEISFNEFLLSLRGQLNERRRQLVLQAFEVLDTDKSGAIELSDITTRYDATKHPDVIAGTRLEADVLKDFLSTFDSVNDKDGKVTPQEFCEYYGNVSSSIDDDDYFELMIRNAWHISGGEGWCANSSCRRILVTHTDGKQTVEEVKNDIGMSSTDTTSIIANLASQGIRDVASIDTTGSCTDTSTPATATVTAAAVASVATATAAAPEGTRVDDMSNTISTSSAPAAVYKNSRGIGGGKSSIIFG